jgi:hypothetical protein
MTSKEGRKMTGVKISKQYKTKQDTLFVVKSIGFFFVSVDCGLLTAIINYFNEAVLS